MIHLMHYLRFEARITVNCIETKGRGFKTPEESTFFSFFFFLFIFLCMSLIPFGKKVSNRNYIVIIDIYWLQNATKMLNLIINMVHNIFKVY
jgi:hypothetical protein